MKLKDKMNKQYTQVAVYVIITCIIIYSLSLIARNAPVIINEIMGRLSWFFNVIKPVLYGFIFAYLIEPVVVFFERHYSKIGFLNKKKASIRSYGVITTILIILIVLTGIISLLVYSVTDQLRVANFDDIIVLSKEYMKTINDFYDMAMRKLNDLNIQSTELSAYLKQASTYLLNIVKSVADGALNSIGNFSGYLTTFFFTLIIGIYFSIDGKMIKAYVSKVFFALCNKRVNKAVRGILKDTDEVFSGYIRGQLMDAFVMMFLIGLSLSIVGIKYAVLIGILAGIGNLIPYCGPIVAYAGTILVSLMNGDIKHLIIGVIVLVVIQTIDANIIGPKLLSHSIQIHPLLVIIFLIFGSAIGGLVGMLLAVPVGALIKLWFVRLVDHQAELKEETEGQDKYVPEKKDPMSRDFEKTTIKKEVIVQETKKEMDKIGVQKNQKIDQAKKGLKTIE